MKLAYSRRLCGDLAYAISLSLGMISVPAFLVSVLPSVTAGH